MIILLKVLFRESGPACKGVGQKLAVDEIELRADGPRLFQIVHFKSRIGGMLCSTSINDICLVNYVYNDGCMGLRSISMTFISVSIVFTSNRVNYL